MVSIGQDRYAPKAVTDLSIKMLSGVPAQELNLGNPALCFRKSILCQLVEITLVVQKILGGGGAGREEGKSTTIPRF